MLTSKFQKYLLFYSSDGKAKWCYISPTQNVCKDALDSWRWTYGGRPRKWSYIACSTPDRKSPICVEHFKGKSCCNFLNQSQIYRMLAYLTILYHHIHYRLGCPDICQSLEYEPDFSDTGKNYITMLNVANQVLKILISKHWRVIKTFHYLIPSVYSFRASVWYRRKNLFIRLCIRNSSLQA